MFLVKYKNNSCCKNVTDSFRAWLIPKYADVIIKAQATMANYCLKYFCCIILRASCNYNICWKNIKIYDVPHLLRLLLS